MHLKLSFVHFHLSSIWQSLSEVLGSVSARLPAKHLFSLGSFNSSLLECRAKPLALLNQTGLGVHFFRLLLICKRVIGQKLTDNMNILI